MPLIQKVAFYFGFGCVAISAGSVAWLNNPEWAHTLFFVAWFTIAIAIVVPMIFSNFGISGKLASVGFALIAFPRLANQFGASFNIEWSYRVGLVLFILGIIFGWFRVSKNGDDS